MVCKTWLLNAEAKIMNFLNCKIREGRSGNLLRIDKWCFLLFLVNPFLEMELFFDFLKSSEIYLSLLF